LLFWGGLGLVQPFDLEENMSYGSEFAIEARLYPTSHRNQGMFGGAYLGYGYTHIPTYYGYPSLLSNPLHGKEVYQRHITASEISIGLKIGYKFIIKTFSNGNAHKRILLEPYFSMSETGWTIEENPPYFSVNTVGVRFVFEWYFPNLAQKEKPYEPPPKIYIEEIP